MLKIALKKKKTDCMLICDTTVCKEAGNQALFRESPQRAWVQVGTLEFILGSNDFIHHVLSLKEVAMGNLQGSCANEQMCGCLQNRKRRKQQHWEERLSRAKRKEKKRLQLGH